MSPQPPKHYRPACEPLERRELPATFRLSNGVLQVFGTDRAEQITVRQDSTRITVDGVGSVAVSQVKLVTVEGYGGNDTIDCRSLRVATVINGGAGDDQIYGSQAGDRINGGSGNDRVFAQAGNDTVYGGDGNDKLFGDANYDHLFGENGNDFLDDGNRYGAEYLVGGAGYDFNADVWAVNGATYTDVVQQGSPTCSFLASLAAVARSGVNFAGWIRYAGYTPQGVPQYSVLFRQGAGWTTQVVAFDGSVSWADTGTALSQPNKVVEGEFWVLLMQRAYKQLRGDGPGWPHEALALLTGSGGTRYQTLTETHKDLLRLAVASRRPVVAATKDNPSSPLVADHAYTVVATLGNNSNFWVQVRNPWGKDTNNGAVDGTDDGLLWLRWDTFKATMAHGIWVV